MKDLNHAYRAEPALHEIDFHPDDFEWVDYGDAKNSIFSFLRKGRSRDTLVLAAFNFTPIVRHNYRIGVPRGGSWRELLK